MIHSPLLFPQEYNGLSELFKSNYANVIKFKSFFSFISRNALAFNSKIQHDLKTITNTDNLDELNTKLSSQRGCYLLFDQTFRCFAELNQVTESILDQLVYPLESFSQNYMEIYKDNLNEMQNIFNDHLKARQSLDKAKNNYLKSAEKTYENENKMNKALKNKVNMSIEEATNHHDISLRLRAQTENSAQLYKYEITKINQMNALNNVKYIDLSSKIKTNEEARIAVIKEVIVKFSTIITNYKAIYERLVDSILCLSKQINIQSDIETVSEMLFNTKASDAIFHNEVFEEYIPSQLNKDKDNVNDKVMKQKISNNNDPYNEIFLDFEVVDQIKEYSVQYQNKLIFEFAKKLMDLKEIPPEEISKIIEMNNINATSLFAKCFIIHFAQKDKKIFYRLFNYDNLLHLSTILNCFCLNSNFTNNKLDLNSLYSSIIFLADKVSYSNIETNETIYLCAVLSKQNKVYSTKSFWKEIMVSNLKCKIEAGINNLIQIEGLKPKKEKRDLFDLKIKIKSSNAKQIKQKSMLETINISKDLKNYNMVPDYKLPFLDDFARNKMYEIIKEFIPHLCYFNYPLLLSTELITDLFTLFNIQNDKRLYLLLYLKSCDLTAKKINNKSDDNKTTPNPTSELKAKKQTMSLIQDKRSKFDLLVNKKASLCKNAILILKIISHYLTIAELLSLFLINKDCLKQKKKIIKNYFNNHTNISVNQRICLWFSILNIESIRRKYDYKTSLEKGETCLELKYKNIIQYDVERTMFPIEDKQHKKTLTSILTAMAYSKDNINYCQGMNYITSFVLQLFNYKEDPTYYFMLALFETMEFEQIYYPKLSKLKAFLFFLERLIGLYLPNISDLFIELNINVNYFCPPWFLTLFTNSSPSVNLSDPPKIVLKIWTDFFLSGWKELLISSIALLKIHEAHIFKLKSEEVLSFIINTVSSSSIINNEQHYDKFTQLLSEYNNITKNIISHINSEYEIYQQINNTDQ